MTKLVKCSACDNEVSNQAESCPKCGNPMNRKKKKSLLGTIGKALLVILVIGGIYNALQDKKKNNNIPKETIAKASQIFDTNLCPEMNEEIEKETGLSALGMAMNIGRGSEYTEAEINSAVDRSLVDLCGCWKDKFIANQYKKEIDVLVSEYDKSKNPRFITKKVKVLKSLQTSCGNNFKKYLDKNLEQVAIGS